jgi:alanyl-tRNA synthetase
VTSAVAGETLEVILAETTLYAESGGQEADSGIIRGDGFELEVLDVQKPIKGLISHRVHVTSGQVSVDDAATTVVDPDWRRGATQAHSGTHLVHAALRQTLGPQAHQSGSYNKAGYLRLDFSWNQPLSAETRSEIEEISNLAIRNDLEVVTRELPLDEAKALGAMALFGEKYGDVVRVVDIGGPWSRELCAGTHVTHSSEIGMINILGESSIGSTNRRVESLVGIEAFRQFAAERSVVTQLAATLKAPREDVPARIQDLVSNLKAAEKKLAAYEASALSARVPSLVDTARTVGELRLVATDAGALSSADDLRALVIGVRERLGSGPAVVALAAVVAEKPVVIVATNNAARALGHRAGALAKQAASVLGGGGGGKDDLAQGGGTLVAAIDSALAAVSQTVLG